MNLPKYPKPIKSWKIKVTDEQQQEEPGTGLRYEVRFSLVNQRGVFELTTGVGTPDGR